MQLLQALQYCDSHSGLPGGRESVNTEGSDEKVNASCFRARTLRFGIFRAACLQQITPLLLTVAQIGHQQQYRANFGGGM